MQMSDSGGRPLHVLYIHCDHFRMLIAPRDVMHRLLYARASLEVSCITTSAPTLPPSAQRGYEASFPPRAFDVDLASAWSSVLADNNVEKFETPLDWLHTTFNSGLGIPEHQYSENWLNGGSFCAELNDVYPHELEHSINLEPWLPPAADINMEIMGMWSTLAGGFQYVFSA
ncbi:hypothetical protein K438DRAFT_166947 [Mycena galopus ATCC 62051]|nr:hypothetical protein K438DRAFT_166947 [Mycena galopus ATCC 62051]